MQGAKFCEPVGNFGILKWGGKHHPKMAVKGGGAMPQMSTAGDRVECNTYILALQKNYKIITLNT